MIFKVVTKQIVCCVTCVAMGLGATLVGSGKVGVTAGRTVPVDSDTVSITDRRSSATPGPGGDAGRAPWHGDTGPRPGAVAAVRPDGGVCGCGGE